ncbi:hypothetical protein, partial [Klebsiella aerogenes]|uniref:hypothetical protein n=1 Tax=Klebsiella aerogenes TaxID=548 RepID=UPI001954CC42
MTLFIVVFGTIAGHLLGTGFFAAQAAWCRATSVCFDPGFDPNIYRALAAAALGHAMRPTSRWKCGFSRCSSSEPRRARSRT